MGILGGALKSSAASLVEDLGPPMWDDLTNARVALYSAMLYLDVPLPCPTYALASFHVARKGSSKNVHDIYSRLCHASFSPPQKLSWFFPMAIAIEQAALEPTCLNDGRRFATKMIRFLN